MFFSPRWEEEKAGVLAPGVKNFSSQSRWDTSVVHVVPYVRVQASTAQLGVAGLLGLKLLVCTINMRQERLYEHAVGWNIWFSKSNSVPAGPGMSS